jgi:hypothetical protein
MIRVEKGTKGYCALNSMKYTNLLKTTVKKKGHKQRSLMKHRSEFFHHLYEHCEGLIEIRPLPSYDQQFFKLDQKDAMWRYCCQHTNANLYFGVATRDGVAAPDGTKGGKANIVNISAVWADCDFKDVDRKALHKKLNQFAFYPSIIVASGGGAHLYWLLKEPVEKDEIGTVEEVNRRIAQSLSGDMNACDAARILRIPGTKNRKYNPPRMVKVTQLNNFYYTLSDFLDILPEAKSSGPTGKNSSGNPKGWLLEALKGVCAHDPGRNSTGTKIAGYFIDKLNYNDVMTIMLAWNTHNHPPMAEADVRRIVNSVSRYKRNEAQNEPPMERVTVSFG